MNDTNKVINEVVEPKYNLRALTASDMGAICKIITAIGAKQFKDCFKNAQGENDVETAGFNVVFDIATIVISNIPKAEIEIQEFVASVAGLKLGAVRKMPFADYGELVMQIIMKDDFKDFFARVMRLFNR